MNTHRAGAYYVIDKTTGGRCRSSIEEGFYGHPVARLIGTEDKLPPSCDGDAFVIRDELQEAGFVWSRDFYIRKLTEAEAQLEEMNHEST